MRRLLILLWVALLGATPAARSQSAPTPPVDVPAESDLAQDGANLDLKHNLDARRDDLLRRFQAWNQQAQAYNTHYANRDLDPNSAEYADGQALLSRLSSDLSSYNADNAAFAADVARLTPRPPPPAVFTEPSPDRVFDPRTLVTRGDYEDAQKREKDLLRHQQLWQNALAKLRGWQQGLEADRGEFSRIQRDAQIDCLHDVLMNIPAGETFEMFAGKNWITKNQAGALAAGYDAIKGLVSSAEGVGAEHSQEQLEKILEAQKNFRDSMTDQAMMTLKETNPKAFEWYGNVGKTLDAAREMLVFSQQSGRSAEAWGKFGVKLGTAVVPLANYIVIADTVGEKIGTRMIVQQPLDSLNEALGKNFDAQRYLQQKLDLVNRDLAAVQETEQKFRAVHPKSEW